MTGTVNLGPRTVGGDNPCYVIAEAGANHNRDLDTARRLIDAAAAAGADAVKFQTYTGSDLYSSKSPRFDYLGDLADTPVHQLLDAIALPRDWQPLLAEHCRQAQIEFLSSPFDRAAIDELDAIGVAALKIASFEIGDLGLIEHAAATGRPLIISTGMATIAEVDDAVAAARAAGATEVCLLQCASLYPAPPGVMNLRSMDTLRRAFGTPVGLSDHTLGVHIAPAAVAMGAALVEKHFTLDRGATGPDHAFAIEPNELTALVRHIRDVEEALGDGRKQGPSSEEAVEMYTKARRSVVAATAIPLGTLIEREMLTVKRPGFGIAPKHLDLVVGRRALVDIEYDDIVTWDMV